MSIILFPFFFRCTDVHYTFIFFEVMRINLDGYAVPRGKAHSTHHLEADPCRPTANAACCLDGVLAHIRRPVFDYETVTIADTTVTIATTSITTKITHSAFSRG